MKILRFIGFCALALTSAFGQGQLSRDNKTHNVNLDFNIGSGKTIDWLSGSAATFSVGSTLTINGILNGTPTGGTFDLSHVTVILAGGGGGGGTGVTDGDKGDISVTGTGVIWTIDNGSITLAKMANVSTASFLGRATSGTGLVEVISTSTARILLSISNLDNTSDASKPISTATQTALDLKPNLAGGNTITGVQQYGGSVLYTPATIPALVIDVTKSSNKKTIAADSTFTFSGTPAAGTYFPLEVYNSDTSSHVITIPNSFSTNHQATITTFTILAGGRECLQFYYDGSIYQVSGVPIAGYSAELAIASATTTDIGAAGSVNLSITGTTTITGFGTVAAGTYRQGRFTGILTLTHNGTSLILPGAANITTGAGDRWGAYSLGSGNWVVLWYTKADGTAVVGAAGGGDFSSNTSSSVDGEIVLFSGSGGKTGKRATGSGIPKITSGVMSTATAETDYVTPTGTGTLSGKTITLTAAHGSDDTLTGMTIAGLNAGATIAQWEAVYLGGSSTWLLADANGSGTFPARGLAVAAYSNTNAAVVIVHGTVRNDAWSWTPGGTIYLSNTAGGLTQTAPSTSGDHVQQVGFALTADIAYFDFASGEYLTVQ